MASNRAKALDSLVRELKADFINCWIPIAQSTLSGSVASVAFNSISADFRTLAIVIQARTDRAAEIDSINVRMNGDSGNNYDRFMVAFTGGTTSYNPTRATAQITGLFQTEAASSRASNFAPGIGFLPGYAQSDREKWILAPLSSKYGDVDADADLVLRIGSGRWRDTSAITSLTFLPNIGTNFVSGSKFELYGIL